MHKNIFTEIFTRSKIIAAIAVILVGVIGRFFLVEYIHIPNFEIITALTLISAVFLGRIWGIVVPLSIIAITDVVIGNSPVLVFTWSAFAIIGVFGMVYKKYETRFVIARSRQQPATKQSLSPDVSAEIASLSASGRIARNDSRRVIALTGVGVISSIFFFLFTNFGWWLMTNMYPHTFSGLMHCYVMGLPFFKNNLVGNLIFVPMFSGTAIVLESAFRNKLWIWNMKKNLVK